MTPSTIQIRPHTFILALGLPDARRAIAEANIVAAAMHRARKLAPESAVLRLFDAEADAALASEDEVDAVFAAVQTAELPLRRVVRSSAEILAFCRDRVSYCVLALAMDYVDDETFVALVHRQRREEEQQLPSDRSPLIDAEEHMRVSAWDMAFGHAWYAYESLRKLEFWHWLVGDDEVVAWCRAPDAHVGYGAPILRKICLKHGWPVRDATVQQVRMQNGLWCSTSCDACARAEKRMKTGGG